MKPASLAVPSIAAGWPLPAAVEARVTLRDGGVSRDAYGAGQGPLGGLNLGARCGDDPDAVAENRMRLAAGLPSWPCWLNQVHGNDVHDADQSAPPVKARVDANLDAEPRADAAISRTPGRVLAILTADCLPVLFSDPEGRRVGAAHAGWRGLAGGVLERTAAALRALPGESDSLVAWMGPAIGPQSFEVGDDVLAAFQASDPGASACFVRGLHPGKWYADLYGLARRRLSAIGIEQVGGGGLCTVADRARFYSHRRDRVSGRFASLIWIKP